MCSVLYTASRELEQNFFHRERVVQLLNTVQVREKRHCFCLFQNSIILVSSAFAQLGVATKAKKVSDEWRGFIL